MRKSCPIPRRNLGIARVRAIKARRAGASVKEIARVLGVHPNSVSRWIGSYNAGGAFKLKGKRASGRPSKLDCKELFPKITRLLRHPASSYGHDSQLWTAKRILGVLKDELDIDLSRSTLQRILQRAGLSFQKPERRAFEQNPAARKHWLSVTWPHLKNTAKRERAVVLFGDEAAIALNPNSGKTWSKVGKTPIIRTTSKRGSVPVISAISPTGKLYFTLPKKNISAVEFIKFLKQILRQIPRKKIYMIVDNCRPHRAKKTSAFIVENPRISLHFLPSYSPDFNPDELTWARLKGLELQAHEARNKDELRSKTLGKMRKIQKDKRNIKKFFGKLNKLNL